MVQKPLIEKTKETGPPRFERESMGVFITYNAVISKPIRMSWLPYGPT